MDKFKQVESLRVRMQNTMSIEQFKSLTEFLYLNANLMSLLVNGELMIISNKDKWIIVSPHVEYVEAMISLNNCG